MAFLDAVFFEELKQGKTIKKCARISQTEAFVYKTASLLYLNSFIHFVDDFDETN